MSTHTPLTVAIIGLGLIGGSLAAALKAAGTARVVACARRQEVLSQARAAGVIDAGAEHVADAVRDADVVVVAVPMLSIDGVFERLRGHLPAGAVLTDVGSVKAPVIAAGKRVFGRQLPELVPGHPIAGSERSGFGARDPALFRGRVVVLTPTEGTDAGALARVEALWTGVGARVVALTPERHDALLAHTSHLPHLLASAYIASLPAQSDWAELTGGGFRDFSRIAASEPAMWRDIMLSNRDSLLDAAAAFSHALSEFTDAVERGDSEALLACLARASALRRDHRRDERPE